MNFKDGDKLTPELLAMSLMKAFSAQTSFRIKTDVTHVIDNEKGQLDDVL